MQEKLVLKTSELSKTKNFKDIQKNIEEREKLQKKLNSLEFDVREQIAKYNEDNPSEYWNLTEENTYRYRGNDENGLRLKTERHIFITTSYYGVYPDRSSWCGNS